MSVGYWFAYCRRARALSLEQLMTELAPAHALLSCERDGPNLVVVTAHDPSGDAEVLVSFDDAPHVNAEALELSERGLSVDAGVPLPDPVALASCDARYEITWELPDGDKSYNAMMAIAAVLESRTGAIIWDATAGRFV